MLTLFLYLITVRCALGAKPFCCGELPPGVTESVKDGNLIAETEFPFVVKLSAKSPVDNEYYDGMGMIVSDEYILTAAHNVAFYDENEKARRLSPDVTVRLGKLSDMMAIGVERVMISPPFFENAGEVTNNDIAILKLKEKIEFGTFYSAICLSSLPVLGTATKLRALGFGLSGDPKNPTDFGTLKSMIVTPAAKADCETLVEFKFPVAKPSMLCFGGPAQRFGCGDSGGCVYEAKNQRAYAKSVYVGLMDPVAKKMKRCAKEDALVATQEGQYTSVAIEPHCSWIHEKTGGAVECVPDNILDINCPRKLKASTRSDNF